jgi:hypothetical protein
MLEQMEDGTSPPGFAFHGRHIGVLGACRFQCEPDESIPRGRRSFLIRFFGVTATAQEHQARTED